MQPHRFHLYVSHIAGRCLTQLVLTQGGHLTEIGRWSLSGQGQAIASRHDGRGLYVGTFIEEGPHNEYRIDAFVRAEGTGHLIPHGSIKTAGYLTHLSADRQDRFLLAASDPSNFILSHPILPDGRLGAVGFQMTTGHRPHHILTDAANRFALVPTLGDNQIIQLIFNQNDGTFGLNSPIIFQEPDGAGCRQVAHHPNGRFVYLVNQEDGSVVAFSYASDRGVLEAIIQRESCLRVPVSNPWAGQILTTPDGTQLFVSERRTNVLARWRIDPETGGLSDRHIIPVGRNPRSFGIDPAGRYLFVAAMDDNTIETYGINGNEGIPQHLSTFVTADGPTWITPTRVTEHCQIKPV